MFLVSRCQLGNEKILVYFYFEKKRKEKSKLTPEIIQTLNTSQMYQTNSIEWPRLFGQPR